MADFNRGSYARVSEIQSMLHPKPSDLLNQSRFFVREGDLNMWNKKKSKKSMRHFFLFNDIMLLCKKQGSKRFFLRIHITLRSPYVTVESIESSGHSSEFRLHCKTRSFILYAASDEERKQWLADLQASISGTHPEENKGATKKEEKIPVASLPQQMKKPNTLAGSDGTARTERAYGINRLKERKSKVRKKCEITNYFSQSVNSVPKKKKQPSSTGPNVRMSTVQPASQPMYSQSQAGTQPNNTNKPPRQKKAAKDDMSVRPKSMMEGQQLTNDPGIFVYNAPTITNNPFLDLPQQNQFAGNPFATNVNARPVSMMMPTTTTFNTFNQPQPQQRPQSTVQPFGSHPFSKYLRPNPFATTNVSQPQMPNPFATNVNASPNANAMNSNPFATNLARPASTTNPFLTNQTPSPQANPFATGY